MGRWSWVSNLEPQSFLHFLPQNISFALSPLVLYLESPSSNFMSECLHLSGLSQQILDPWERFVWTWGFVASFILIRRHRFSINLIHRRATHTKIKRAVVFKADVRPWERVGRWVWMLVWSWAPLKVSWPVNSSGDFNSGGLKVYVYISTGIQLWVPGHS